MSKIVLDRDKLRYLSDNFISKLSTNKSLMNKFVLFFNDETVEDGLYELYKSYSHGKDYDDKFYEKYKQVMNEYGWNVNLTHPKKEDDWYGLRFYLDDAPLDIHIIKAETYPLSDEEDKRVRNHIVSVFFPYFIGDIFTHLCERM